MSRKILVAVFATLVLVLSVQAQSDLLTANKAEITTDPVFSYARVVNLVQWPEAAGGNDHWYGVLVEVLYWEEADSMSQLLELEGRSGYLATITSPAENEFILNSVIAGTSQSSVLDEFWLGGRDIGGEWIWMTGEPLTVSSQAP